MVTRNQGEPLLPFPEHRLGRAPTSNRMPELSRWSRCVLPLVTASSRNRPTSFDRPDLGPTALPRSPATDSSRRGCPCE